MRTIDLLQTDGIPGDVMWHIKKMGIEFIADPHVEGMPVYLGGGASSTVYSVMWKGQEAVLKSSRMRSDHEMACALEDLREKLPKIHCRHVMRVLDRAEFPLRNRYITVVERLVHLPEDVKLKVWTQLGPMSKSDMVNVVDRNGGPEVFFADIVDYAAHKGRRFDLPDGFEEMVAVGADTFAAAFRENPRDLFGSATIGWHKILSMVPESDVEVMRIIGDTFYEEVRESMETNAVFPREGGWNAGMHVRRKYRQDLPKEAREFLSFLMYLRNEIGIEWGDVHSSNVMLRPSTGDWVLSDAGYFRGVR